MLAILHPDTDENSEDYKKTLQFLEGLQLDLADALTGTADNAADFLESLGAAAIKTVAHDQDGLFAFVEVMDEATQPLDALTVLDDLIGGTGGRVGNDVFEAAFFAFLNRIVQGEGLEVGELEALDGTLGKVEVFGDLSVGRRATELLGQLNLGSADFVDLAGGRDGYANGAAFLRQGTAHGLLDPPGRITAELGALRRIEFLGGSHEPDVPLGYEIQKRQTEALEIMGDFDNQSQIRLDQFLPRHLIPSLDLGSQLDFLFLADQRDFAYILHIGFHWIILVVHLSPFSRSLSLIRCVLKNS